VLLFEGDKEVIRVPRDIGGLILDPFDVVYGFLQDYHQMVSDIDEGILAGIESLRATPSGTLKESQVVERRTEILREPTEIHRGVGCLADVALEPRISVFSDCQEDTVVEEEVIAIVLSIQCLTETERIHARDRGGGDLPASHRH
jgi:hypothetical protein